MNELLKRLGLTQMARALPSLLDQARAQQLSYDAFLRQALEAEVSGRQQRALERRVRAAHLPRRSRLETFDFSFQPTLSERLVRELSSLRFVQTATNVIFLGPPGVGKTHLASALALSAIEAGYSALFTTLSQLANALSPSGVAVTETGSHRFPEKLPRRPSGGSQPHGKSRSSAPCNVP